VIEIFNARTTGVQTSRDELVIAISADELQTRIAKFADPKIGDDFFRNEFFGEKRTPYLRGDTRGWKLSDARQWARDNLAELRESISVFAYRPFDSRLLTNHANMIDWPRYEVMRHLKGENIALITSRQAGAIGDGEFDAAMVAIHPVDLNFYRRGGGYVFPAHVFREDNTESIRTENLSPAIRAFVDDRYEHHYTPEEILSYIYAVLYTPSYRRRYAEFLRIDFPRIPFPESKLGWALVQAHLLRKFPREGLAQDHGKGEYEVEAVRYDATDEAAWINKTQCFKPVPPAVWEFHIGGYQVLDKYLKSRKGRKLKLDEINHVAAVANALAFTIEQMAKIDVAYRTAFPDRG
jgi:predicted helicase